MGKLQLNARLYDGSKLVDQNSDKAIVLNNYFHSCFSTSQPPLDELLDRLEPADCPPDLLCTEDEVFDLVASLDISKSTGPDGVSAKMLKGTAASIVFSLTKTLQSINLTRSFPQ